jgi:iron(III) transport system permease protein
LATIAERSSFVGYALPGVVVALSLVFFGARVLAPLYQTHAMLTFGYVVLFVPMAVGALRTSILQVSPSLEEASRSLGRGWWATVRLVVLPLVRPGVMAGFALVFLTVMKELPATLLLAPIGFDTLASEMWNAAAGGFFARAAAPALMLILLSSVPLAVLVARDARREQGYGRRDGSP